MFVKLTTIVGPHCTKIVEDILWQNSIDYEKIAGQYNIYLFNVKDTDRNKAMQLITQALSNELTRITDK